jgi:hypothetical protein
VSDVIRYTDSAGWSWRVCEVADRAPAADREDEPLVPEVEPGHGRLYFFSRLGTRRLLHYPESWPSLPHRDLEELCHQAELLAAPMRLA